MVSDILTAADGGRRINVPVFAISGGFISLFVLLSLIDVELVSFLVNEGFAWSAEVFGAYWQILVLLTFFIGLGIAFSPAGSVIMGNAKTPEMSTFRWVACILCTLLASGGVFWAAGEPLAHFLTPPPVFDAPAGSAEAAYPALAQSFMHWGFLAWAILGSLTAMILMHYHHKEGQPLTPRTLLYPVFGESAVQGPLGIVVDAACVIAVVAGTIGPIGFLGLQVSYSLSALFGTTDGLAMQAAVIGVLVAIYTVSAMTGITRGIQLLSRINVVMALGLLVFIFLFGPTSFILDAYVQSMGLYVSEFIPMATFRADPDWLSWWTVFFWGWFIGYGPLMAMFIAKISRGRSLRSIIFAVSILAPVATTFWFTIIGGTGIFYELQNPESVSQAFAQGIDLPAALLAMTTQLPAGMLVSLLFIVLTTIFVATTGDSMTYTIAMVMTGSDEPSTAVRVFWGVAMGVTAVVLIAIGSGTVGALQSFIVVTAVPVSLILLPSLWNAPQLAIRLARGQA